jgi:hypothetical protein
MSSAVQRCCATYIRHAAMIPVLLVRSHHTFAARAASSNAFIVMR